MSLPDATDCSSRKYTIKRSRRGVDDVEERQITIRSDLSFSFPCVSRQRPCRTETCSPCGVVQFEMELAEIRMGCSKGLRELTATRSSSARTGGVLSQWKVHPTTTNSVVQRTRRNKTKLSKVISRSRAERSEVEVHDRSLVLRTTLRTMRARPHLTLGQDDEQRFRMEVRSSRTEGGFHRDGNSGSDRWRRPASSVAENAAGL